ncbi:MAG: hypothetical protein PVH19_11900 [Planctomycetia bacterium]
MSRNCAIIASFLLVTLGLSSPALAKAYTLESTRSRGEVDRVEVSMDVKGNLRFTDKEDVDTVPMELSGKVVYYERTVALSKEPKGHSRALRFYKSLETDLKIGKTEQKPTLRPERSLIGVQIDGMERTLFSPEGELTREELELIETMVDSLILDRLLPDKAVSLGDTWEVPEETAATMTGLDRIRDGRIVCKLTEIDDDRALIDMNGELDGASRGVGNTIRLKARFRFNRHLNRIDWLGMVFEEVSEIGPVEAGGKAIAKLQVNISPRGQVAKAKLPETVREKLSDDALSELTLYAIDSLTRLSFVPKNGHWRMVHDRRWYEYGNEKSLGVLRFMDRGDLIAQCNVATLETLALEDLPTLEKFQKEIKEAMGERFGQFAAAKQWASDQDYRIYRVVVQGVVGKGTPAELPVQWHYYLVADRHGRQVGLTFTVEAALVERFGDQAQKLVDAVRFSENLTVSRDQEKK